MDKQIEIYGIRSIIEAIESSKDISRVYLLKSNSHKSNLFKTLVSLLENNHIKYSFVPKEKFKKFENKNHQGAFAVLSPIKLLSIEELISVTFENKSSKTYDFRMCGPQHDELVRMYGPLQGQKKQLKQSKLTLLE